MKVYLVMEMCPHMWDVPVGVFSSEEKALSECERLANEALPYHRKRAPEFGDKAKPSDYGVLETKADYIKGKKKVKLTGPGFGVYFRREWMGDKEPTWPKVSYHVEEFDVDRKAKSFHGWKL